MTQLFNASTLAISSGEENLEKSDTGQDSDEFLVDQGEYPEEQNSDSETPRASTPSVAAPTVDDDSDQDSNFSHSAERSRSSVDSDGVSSSENESRDRSVRRRAVRGRRARGGGTRGGIHGGTRRRTTPGQGRRGHRTQTGNTPARDGRGDGTTQGQAGTRTWTWNRNTHMNNQQLPFTGSPGLTVRMPATSTILDYYKLFITDNIMNMILVETNRYAQEKIARWQPISKNDLERAFALVMLMGIIRKPTIKSYWSTDPKVSTPYFNSVMARDKFMRILRALHFVDNSVQATERAHKINPILQILNERFRTVYNMKQHICIDETLLLWKGRLVFKQYIPKKRARFGIKGYVLAESDTGYVYKYSLYVGKDRETSDISQGVAHKIVLDMMDGLLDTGHELIMDNWYTSPALLKELYEKDTYAYGTLRSNRKHVPKELKKKDPDTDLKKGELQYFTCPPVLTGCWVDRNFICFASNKHSTFELEELERRHDGQPRFKPSPIIDYNKYMGGVDLADQMTKYYHLDRRTIKWYKKLFFHLIDLSIHNSYILYKQNKEPVTALSFRLRLIDELMLAAGPDNTCRGGAAGRPRPTGTDLARLNSVNHYRSINPESEVTCRVKARSCRVCNKQKRSEAANRQRTETKYCCVECGNIPLCPAPCFRKWHTNQNL